MTYYTCPKCKYTTQNRNALLIHLKKKKPCYRTKSSNDVNDEDVAAEYLISELERKKGSKERTCTNNASIVSCEQCGQKFNHRSTLSRHKKTHCGTKCNHDDCNDCNSTTRTNIINDSESIRELRQRCKELQMQIELLNNRPTISTTYNSVNNNNNNIYINALGKEDLTCITPQMVDAYIRKTTKGLVELTEKIHFDTVESNCNLRAKLLYPEHVEFYDGQNWKYGPKNRVVREVVDASHNIMSNRYDENYQHIHSSMSSAMSDFVDRWMRKMSKTNAQLYLDVMAEVYSCILNRTREMELK